ncbi:chloride intracellular channel protein 1 [Nematostella vectensis]|uniref:chloride intracellular channel protein 1 n=1 Tax=Nematostella vectensis TaxID=45351 RepID=UPI0013905F88|nr:chloride intracellular channel protein 1 [Nematostella vectensis]
MKKLIAFMKASRADARRVGACHDSHYLLMILKGLAPKLEKEGITIEYKFLDESKKQLDPSFQKLDSTMLPVLLVMEDDIVETETQDTQEMVDRLEKLANLRLNSNNEHFNGEVRKFTPFQKFSAWLRSPERSERVYEKELEHVDSLLGEEPGVYLEGDHPTINDYRLLAKLYQTGTAAEKLKGYVIPDRLARLKKFMAEGQQLGTFKDTCPDKNEIIEKFTSIHG